MEDENCFPGRQKYFSGLQKLSLDNTSVVQFHYENKLLCSLTKIKFHTKQARRKTTKNPTHRLSPVIHLNRFSLAKQPKHSNKTHIHRTIIRRYSFLKFETTQKLNHVGIIHCKYYSTDKTKLFGRNRNSVLFGCWGSGISIQVEDGSMCLLATL